MKTPKPANADMVSSPIFSGRADFHQAQAVLILQDQEINRTLHNFINEVTYGSTRFRLVDSPQLQQQAAFADRERDLRL